MKKKLLCLFSFSFLLMSLASCSQSEIEEKPVQDEETTLPDPKGALQEIFASMRDNNFTLSYTDSYAAGGVEREQTTRYTSYSLESEGDLGFNGYAQNDECVFSYTLEGDDVVSGVPVIDYSNGVMVADIYDYRDGLDEFDYTYLPSNYEAGSIYEYKFGKNAKNDELILTVFLRKTYNPAALPQKVTFQVVQNQLQIDCISRYYEVQDAYDTAHVVALDIGRTENPEIKKYLEDGKSSKTPLDRKFFELIAPYLEENNYKTTLDARGLRSASGGYETFYEDQYFLNDAIVYDTKSAGTITGDLQTPGAVTTFSLDSLDDDELTITSTPSNQGEGFYTNLYGEYLSYSMTSLNFSNFIGYIDEEHKDSYYITDNQTQSILAYICKYELDTTERGLRSLRLEVTDWENHDFTLYFEVYNPTTSLDLGNYKVSFSDPGKVEFPCVDRYLNIGESAFNQDKSELESVLNKFKNHNYSLDVLTEQGLAKTYYTPNYKYLEVYGAPNANYGYIKEGGAIYEFTLTYGNNGEVSSINIDRNIDYASKGMTLPGCGDFNGAENDLFYFSAFNDNVYNYDQYSQDSILGYSYWKNNSRSDDGSTIFSNQVLKYFYPADTTGALPQGAGFMVSDSENSYDTRASLFLVYSSSDGLRYGGQYTTFYDIGGTHFKYLDNYISKNS